MSEPWMKTATYRTLDGKPLVIEYDALAPCIGCGLPVWEASMGGTVVCPWCDTGTNRNGDRIVEPRKATPEEYAAAVAAMRP